MLGNSLCHTERKTKGESKSSSFLNRILHLILFVLADLSITNALGILTTGNSKINNWRLLFRISFIKDHIMSFVNVILIANWKIISFITLY